MRARRVCLLLALHAAIPPQPDATASLAHGLVAPDEPRSFMRRRGVLTPGQRRALREVRARRELRARLSPRSLAPPAHLTPRFSVSSGPSTGSTSRRAATRGRTTPTAEAKDTRFRAAATARRAASDGGAARAAAATSHASRCSAGVSVEA